MTAIRTASDPVALRDASTAESSATAMLLIRHAHTEAVDQWLAGRAFDTPLSRLGWRQAVALARALEPIRLAAIYSSPLRRARQTAAAIARRQGIAVELFEPLNEIDFGSWTGKSFDALAADPAWRAFNDTRAAATIPDGETPLAVQARAVAGFSLLASRHAGQTVALVSHGDVLRSALLHYAGFSLNDYHRFAIHPASVSRIEISPANVRVVSVNQCVDRRARRRDGAQFVQQPSPCG